MGAWKMTYYGLFKFKLFTACLNQSYAKIPINGDNSGAAFVETAYIAVLPDAMYGSLLTVKNLTCGTSFRATRKLLRQVNISKHGCRGMSSSVPVFRILSLTLISNALIRSEISQ
ncbi:unnamed protein product [Sphenostylis stenocarpa]|uniref:Uncharacterized protein n=1 Tax=Sphenostylis stenocarpa TaxID=92480 RepID=A0AA86T250_9FABA|nr:unnamed protein product [Sphenostylis stenocarpa]